MNPLTMQENAVKNIQRYLRTLSAEQNRKIFSVPIDGIYDSVTREAVAEFQRLYSLPVTGTVDKITFDLLFLEHQRILRNNEKEYPEFFPDVPIGYVTEFGEKSYFIALLQFILEELRVSYDTIPFFDRSGEFDMDTSLAIKEFQRLSSLPVTGKVNRETWNSLARAYNTLYY